MDEEDTVPMLQPCSICGRTFNPEVLARHQGVCKKNTQNSKKRKVFDSSKQRTDFIPLEIKKQTESSPATKPSTKRHTNSDWKRKHEDFISSIRAAREVTSLIKSGAPLPPPKPSAPNPDYQQCPYCGRRFQDSAAERHIPFCKEQASRRPRNLRDNDGQQKLNKRMQYKPPMPRKRSGSVNYPVESHHPGNSVVTRNSNFSGRSPDSSGVNRSSNISVSRKPPTPSKQPMGRTRVINSNSDIDYSQPRKAPNSRQAQTPAHRLTTPSHSTTIIERSQHLTSQQRAPSPPVDRIINHDNAPLPALQRHHLANGRVSSGSSTGSTSREAPLNTHGMLMSKFCYECGNKYPVPQAKYCCMCGTKRI